MRTAAFLLVLTVACSACSAEQTRGANETPAVAPPQTAGSANSTPLPARDAASVPQEFLDLWKQAATGQGRGGQGGYTYQYAVQGSRAAAIMVPRSIPRDDATLIAVISDFARRALNADLSGFSPSLAPTAHGNAIAFRRGTATYYVLTIKNETREGLYGPGEPHTLLFWRE